MPDLIAPIALVFPESRFQRFSESRGIDFRQIQDLCVAEYKEARLAIARTPVDPARLETAFSTRVTHSFARHVDVPNPRVVRLEGEVNGSAEQLVIFGREALAVEEGPKGPMRAAEAFARGMLRRASPALKSDALAQAASILGDAPVRAFAPGPFEGEWARGLGGLLRASTAIGASATPAGRSIAIRLVITGAWGIDASAAASRLAAAINVLSESPLGRLLGLHDPLEEPRVRTTDDALILEMTIDATTFARGMHDAVDAEIAEILRLDRAH